MSNNLSDVWVEVENLLNQNISIIPVRDKNEIFNGKLYKAKTPYREWALYQHEIIDRAVLYNLMTDHNTTAIAMVCGKISGNLEVIDFDVKYKPGCDAIIINALNEFYPDILAKMRVHKTRSGGTHLVYKIKDHEVPPSTHLCNRPATDEEIQENPNNKKKYRTFVETRGTGALATAPPSLGYTIRKNIPIQEISWEERCSLIEFIKNYNEYLPDEPKPYKPPKSEQAYYDENPFEHYNRTVDFCALMIEFNWGFVKKFGNYIWFTRPGGRRNEVHGAINLDKNTFRVWGTKADLDSERSYTASTILAHYKFNNNKSETYHYLVQQGYGRIKPHIEQNLVKKKALQNEAMPANASKSSIEQYEEIIKNLKEAHPYGIFWELGEDNKIEISRLRLNSVLTSLGFRLYNNDLVQIVEKFIHKRDERFIYDQIREYINEDDEKVYEEIYNATQSFLQRNGKFELSQLSYLDQNNILNDTRNVCYKFYQNGFILINKDGYSLQPYELIEDKLIWHEKIQQREFIPSSLNYSLAGDTNSSVPDDGSSRGDGLYISFLNLSCNLASNRTHVMKVIGYLAHDYKDSTTAYIITLVEQCADPKDGGGSGKNLFCELLSHTTTIKTVAAAQKRSADHTNILQSWNGERLFIFSDPKKDFDFEVLKEFSSGVATVKKLFKDERSASNKELPKFIIPTNFSFEITDGGLKRRTIAIEFTNFFTVNGGVKKYFNKNFPDSNGLGDWSPEDWQEYDHFICESIQQWLKSDLELEPIELSSTGWEKQFIHTYNPYTVDFIKDHWDYFIKSDFISNQQLKDLLDKWCIENNINLKFKPTTFKLNKALNDWCEKHNFKMDANRIETMNGIKIRGRSFEPSFI